MNPVSCAPTDQLNASTYAFLSAGCQQQPAYILAVVPSYGAEWFIRVGEFCSGQFSLTILK